MSAPATCRSSRTTSRSASHGSWEVDRGHRRRPCGGCRPTAGRATCASQNVVERAVAFERPGARLRRRLGPGRSCRSGGACDGSASTGATGPRSRTGPAAAVLQTLDHVQRQHILDVLEETQWVIEGPGGAAAGSGRAEYAPSRMQKLRISEPSPSSLPRPEGCEPDRTGSAVLRIVRRRSEAP